MADMKDALRRAAEDHRPPEDWLDRIRERARKKRRTRQALARGVGLGLPFVLLVALVAVFGSRERPRPDAATPPDTECRIDVGVEPTGWWRGDGSPVDEVGDRDAILRRGATYAPGVIGEAFALDGEDDFVEVPDDPALNVGTSDFTIALWVRFRSTKGEQVLAEKWVEQGENSLGWTLTKLRSNVIGFGLAGKEGVDTDALDLPLDTWIHVTSRRRGGSLSIFVNGDLMARAAIRDVEISGDSAASLKFGHRGSPGDTPGSRDDRGFFLRGDLDEIQLFVGRGPSNAQIRRIVQSQSACAT